MSNGGDLLRMLMPAVSPVPTRDAPRPDALPIESRSFESLLEEANRIDHTEPIEETTHADQSTKTDKGNEAGRALASLTGIESIQNASLRRIVADAAGK